MGEQTKTWPKTEEELFADPELMQKAVLAYAFNASANNPIATGSFVHGFVMAATLREEQPAIVDAFMASLREGDSPFDQFPLIRKAILKFVQDICDARRDTNALRDAMRAAMQATIKSMRGKEAE